MDQCYLSKTVLKLAGGGRCIPHVLPLDPPLAIAPEQHSSIETLQRWRAVDDSAFDLTGPNIEHKTSCANNDVLSLNTTPTGWLAHVNYLTLFNDKKF